MRERREDDSNGNELKRIFVSISKVEWVFFSTETRITIEKEKNHEKIEKDLSRGVARKKDTV